MGVGEWLILAALTLIVAWLLSRVLRFMLLRVVVPILESEPVARYVSVKHSDDEEDELTSTSNRYAPPQYQPSIPDMDAAIPAPIPPVSTSMIPDVASAYQALPRIEQLTFLAGLRDDSGEYLLSANALAKAFGGDRNETLAAIRDVRKDSARPRDQWEQVGPRSFTRRSA